MLLLNLFWKELKVMIEIIILHTLENIKSKFLAVLPIKSFVLMLNLVIQLFFTGENVVYRFIKGILKGYNYCKKVIKKHFNKNFVMSSEDEERFQSSNKCWIWDKLFDVGDNKVRNYGYVTGRYRGSAH